MTTDDGKLRALDLIAQAFENHEVDKTTPDDPEPEPSWDKEILLPQYQVFVCYETVALVMEHKTDDFLVLLLIGSVQKGDGVTALRELLKDISPNTATRMVDQCTGSDWRRDERSKTG